MMRRLAIAAVVLCIAAQPAGAETAQPQPQIFVTISSAVDHTPGTVSEHARNADTIRRVLLSALARTPQLTSTVADVRRFGLDVRKIDIEVVTLHVDRRGDDIEVSAKLRLVVCDEHNHMLSILSGGASAKRPARTFRADQLDELRRDALEGAVRGMFTPLRTHLLKPSV
jgi:hypothetical protein